MNTAPTTSNAIELIHEGKYAAEIPVEPIEADEEGGWSPTLTPGNRRRRDAVRLALRRRALPAAARHARLFALTPLA
jgi:hypothetical protein